MPSEIQILRILNNTQTSRQIVDGFHAFSRDTITLQQGQCIIKLRDSLPQKKFTSLAQLQGHCGLTDDTREIRPAPTKDYPVLMLPIRLETRFVDNDLLIRIYPDKISIETHEELLTESEFSSGIRYREIIQNGSEDEIREAWHRLAHTFGPKRAAWIRKTVLALKPRKKPKFKASSWTQAPRLRTLPDKFAVYLYQNNTLLKGPLYGNPVKPDLSLIAAPKLTQTDLFDSKSDWVFDFNRALACGMALKISFNDEEIKENQRHGFSRVVVVGLQSTSADKGVQLVEQLIENHHYTNGFAFLEPGTPTNNTKEAKSGYSDTKADYPESYQTEVAGPPHWEYMPSIPRNNAQRLGHALGLGLKPQALRYIQLADDMRDLYTKDLRAALWPATGDYFLRTMLPGFLNDNALNDLSHHFSCYVHAGGPLPAIRVGDQPYGILPVSTLRPENNVKAGLFENIDIEGVEYPDKGEFEDKLAYYLIKLAKKWLQYARNPYLVPRINTTNDPDKELLQVLAMEPVSITYQARPFVDERFVAFLLVAMRNFVFGPGTPYDEANPSPGYWVHQWSKLWKEKQAETAGVLYKLSGKPLQEIKDQPLLKVSGWWEGLDQPLNYAIGEAPEDAPLNYLLSLCKRLPAESGPLLFNLLKRSLMLESQKKPVTSEAISALKRLVSRSHLGFFNLVTSPRQIMERIKDDPDFNVASPDAYGIGETVAKRIIETRDALPGKRFTSMQQIDDVFGVGQDKMRDILYSFPEHVQDLDYDRLLREDLDLCTHRLDAWLTSIVTKRMEAMRNKNPSGIYIGAYGWVEDLKPDQVDAKPEKKHIKTPDNALDRIRDRRTNKVEAVLYKNPLDARFGAGDRTNDFKPAKIGKSEGFIHAPSAAQAATAAVLHNAYLTHDYDQANVSGSGSMSPNPFRINLNSERVRSGLSLLEGVRQGQSLGALLGYQFERSLHERHIHIHPHTNAEIILTQYIDDFRSAFPIVANKETRPVGDESIEALAARNVVDGLALARAWRAAIKQPLNHFANIHETLGQIGNQTELRAHLNNLLESLDCVSDLLVHEGVYQAVQGNYDRGGAALEAAAGNLNPPKIESIKTPVAGRTFSQRVCLLFYEHDEKQDIYRPYLKISDFRKLAEPCIAAWFERLLGDMTHIGCSVSFESENNTNITAAISLADLDISAIDLLYLSSTPPGSDETELDRRIKYYVRNRNGLSYNNPISIDYNYARFANGILDAIEVGSCTLNMLNAAGHLRPEMLSRPSLAEKALFKQEDVNDLKDRIEKKLLPLFNKTIDNLEDNVISDPENIETQVRDKIISALFDAAYLGISAAIPAGSDEPPRELEDRRSAVSGELEKRLKKYEIAMSQSIAEAGDYTKAISKLIEAVKALLGPGFIVLPSFTLPGDEEFSKSIQSNPIVTEDEQIRSWLQQTSSTHKPLQDVDTFLMVSEAWKQSARNNGDFPLSFHVAQLPTEAAETWLGIEHGFDATSTQYQGETLSLVTALSQPVSELSREQRVAGVLLDQWDEFLPSDTVNTSMAFHYDAPNTQAPQSLLLAVPDKITPDPREWREDDLAAIVSDTLDLAKIRTVDIDALKEVASAEGEKPDMGAILPAVMLSADQDNTGWERDVMMNSFEDWVDILTPFNCHYLFGGIVENTTLTFECGLQINLFHSPAISFLLNLCHQQIGLLRPGGTFKIEYPEATHKVSFQIGLPELQYPILSVDIDNAIEILNNLIFEIQGYNSNGEEIDITVQRQILGGLICWNYENTRNITWITSIVINASDLKVLTINLGENVVIQKVCFAGFKCNH